MKRSVPCTEPGCDAVASMPSQLVGPWRPMCLPHRRAIRFATSPRAASDAARWERRRDRRLQAKHSRPPKGMREAAFEAAGNRCERCGSPEALELDHVHEIRIRPDLSHDQSNLQVLCRTCHYRKTRAVNEALYAYARVTPALQEFILRCVEDEFEEVAAS